MVTDKTFDRALDRLRRPGATLTLTYTRDTVSGRSFHIHPDGVRIAERSGLRFLVRVGVRHEPSRAPSDRRLAETLDLEFAGLRYTVAIGRFPDGRSGEVFVANCKVGNAADVAVRDAGILISLLLQHGCAAETISHAISRNGDGTPAGVIGAVIDLVTRRP